MYVAGNAVSRYSRIKRHSTKSRKYVVIPILCIIITVAILALGLGIGLSQNSDSDNHLSSTTQSTYTSNFEVVTDSRQCRKIGLDVLKDGGHAVDAAIAGLICTGVVNIHSTGVGGGGFMNIYDRNQKKSIILDYREVGPASLTPDSYDDESSKKTVGGFTVAVPGELQGLKHAHDMYGKLPWKQLIKPSIQLARKGSIVEKQLAKMIQINLPALKKDPGLRELFCKNKDCSSYKVTDDAIINNKYADTLEKVAQNHDVINNGALSQSFIDDVNSRGGNMTLDDLKSYKVLQKDALSMRFEDLKLNLLTTPLPGGGSILIHILNMIKGYKFNASSEDSLKKKILTYHRLAEIFKFSYAQRPYLGDPDNVNIPKRTQFQEFIRGFLDNEEVEKRRLKIDDTSTKQTSYYSKLIVTTEDFGGTHMSVIDKDGNAVVATNSINSPFGATFRSLKTGIIFNNNLKSFFTRSSFKYTDSNTPIYGKLPLYNFPKSGRRPLSSACPTIITDKDGNVVMAIGSSSGIAMPLTTAWVILKKFYMKYNVADAVNDRRLQHTYSPTYIQNEVEKELEENIVNGLKQKNHQIKKHSLHANVGALYNGDNQSILFAVDD